MKISIRLWRYNSCLTIRKEGNEYKILLFNIKCVYYSVLYSRLSSNIDSSDPLRPACIHCFFFELNFCINGDIPSSQLAIDMFVLF